MRSGGRLAVFVGKWILVPVALALAGYYFVGPRIGKTPALDKVLPSRAAEQTEQAKPDPLAIQSTDRPKKNIVEPEVEVTAEPAPRRRATTRRREARPEAPREETALPPAEDPASSGGMEDVPSTPPESDPASGGAGA